MDTKVGVIIHTKNRADYVSSAIQNVQDQTLGDFEIVIVARYCECRERTHM